MIHGSTHTGAALDSTPGGGEGWLSYAVRNKLATFVVNQPGRGRSGFDQSVILEAKATGNWNLVPSSFGRITDDGAWTTWFGHIVSTQGPDLTTGKVVSATATQAIRILPKTPPESRRKPTASIRQRSRFRLDQFR